jgi:DNA repair ATPase RecN
MILEGFEIENWSCIKRVAVDSLPSTGVIVLHGPNGTGKSSIIEALRACLMDAKSTSKVLGRGFTKNSSEKPRVSVTFRAAGALWKITKQFNSKNSKLERRTASGDWKLETSDPSEAHERTRLLTGGSVSSLGLHQLLWLTQAEFHLPDPKKLDTGVQSQLRGILGVLQTPLDDRFLARVKEKWACWFGVRSKRGEKPKLKKDCPLDKALAARETQRKELELIEERYRSYEDMIERSSDLEVLSRNLRQQLAAKKQVRDSLQEEYEKSITRLNDHQAALERVVTVEKTLKDAQDRQQARAEAERQLHQAERSAEEARQKVDEKDRQLRAAEQKLWDLRDALQVWRNKGRELQTRRDQVTGRLGRLVLIERATRQRESLRRGIEANSSLQALKDQARQHPAPDAATLKKFEDNRTKAGRIQANLEAAAITLTIVPEPGASVPRLVVDTAPVEARPPTAGAPMRCSVRRKAEIAIPGWGRAEVARGSDARSLDQMEQDLMELERTFADDVAAFGIGAGDPAALDRLRDLVAQEEVRQPRMKSKEEEIGLFAPPRTRGVAERGCRS